VIVRKFTVDGVVVRGATTCESSQGEETERETRGRRALEGFQFSPSPESRSQSVQAENKQ
jgi:hypothetical protein